MSTLKSWSLNTYTNSTWTDFIVGTSNNETVRGITISNTTGAPINLQMRVTSAIATPQATVLPLTSIAANTSLQLNTDPLNLIAAQRLQINAAAAGLEFYASGISYTTS